jgi:DNA (cytosine-5)-methyltransferase 1
MHLRMIDSFAGIGGFHEAAKEIAEVVMAIEWDKDCQMTYSLNYPNIPILGDITRIDPVTLPDHDLLTGGFPCQPFSKNGKWYNHANRTIDSKQDSRTNLFQNLCHILEIKQPKAFIFENVKGLKASKNELGNSYFDLIIQNIQDSGYLVKHMVLSPHMFGVPQNRQRVFFVGVRKDLEKFYNKFEFPVAIPNTCAIKDILEDTVDSKYLIQAAWAGRVLTASTKRPSTELFSNKLSGFKQGTPRETVVRAIYKEKLKQNKIPNSPTGKISAVAVIYGDTPSGGPRQQDKVFSRYGLSPTLTTLQLTVPVIDVPSGCRILTPRECARLQGFPDTFKLATKDSVAYRQIGNAVCVKLVKEILINLKITGIFDLV